MELKQRIQRREGTWKSWILGFWDEVGIMCFVIEVRDQDLREYSVGFMRDYWGKIMVNMGNGKQKEVGKNDNLGNIQFFETLEQFLHSNFSAISWTKEGFPLGFLGKTYHKSFTLTIQKPRISHGYEPTCEFVLRGGILVFFRTKFGLKPQCAARLTQRAARL